VQVLKGRNARALVGSEIAFVGLNQQIVQSSEDHPARRIVVDFLARCSDELLFLFFIGSEIAF
jgi:hypothetical protein